MDKKNLFYIVEVGTNRRIKSDISTPLMVLDEYIDDEMRLFGSAYKKMSIEEYERTFTDIPDEQDKEE